MLGQGQGGKRTAKEPGALRAAVHDAPRYRPIPSSEMILNSPRPRNASGFVWRLILSTSSGSRMISPIPIKLVVSMHYTSSGWSLHLPSGSRVHNSLPGPPSERIVKVRAVVLGQVVPGERLAAVLVDALEDLVARGVAQPREERGEFAGERCGGVLLENDLVQSAGRRDLWLQSDANGGSKMSQDSPVPGCSSIVLRSCQPGWVRIVSSLSGLCVRNSGVVQDGKPSARQYRRCLETGQSLPVVCGRPHIPEPSSLAVADSFLTSLEDGPAPAWTTGGDMAAERNELKKQIKLIQEETTKQRSRPRKSRTATPAVSPIRSLQIFRCSPACASLE